MSGKNKIILIGSLLILLIISSIICIFIPTIDIDINGTKIQTISVGEEYSELGASVYLKSFNRKEELDYEISGNVDVSTVGKYVITYKVKKGSLLKESIRIVNVVDNTTPVITLQEEIKLCRKNNLVEINAKAVDNYDGDITEKIKYKLKNGNIYLTVSDSSNNKTEIKEKVKYLDDEKPKITLVGSNIIYMNLGEKYEELGATSYDSCDGNITNKIKIEGKVDTSHAGIYQLTYKVTDSSGYDNVVTRNVIVKEDNIIEYPVIKGAKIYLTFDDGPSQYTEPILEILDKYNIKATFFVTNQFPDYQHLIKKEYEAGHTVGIHTYSHKWSIYESTESYLEDFNKINEIVISQTGIEPKLFRFPGGSSNTVSRNYKKGIMSKLSKIMTDKGYVYFDWTFDSGDTSTKDSSAEAILKNFKINLKGDGEYVVLMHDIKKSTLEVLPKIIEFAQVRGYTFAALTENSPTEHFKIAN